MDVITAKKSHGSGRTLGLLLALVLNIRHLAVPLGAHTDVFPHCHAAQLHETPSSA